jgi:hypothetical protein
MTKKPPMLPKSVKIGMHDIKIVAMTKEIHDVDDNDGLYSARTRTIHIWKDQVTTDLLEALWHEIKHGVFEATKLSEADKIEEEDVVARCSPVELQVLRDNPQLLAWINWYCTL